MSMYQVYLYIKENNVQKTAEQDKYSLLKTTQIFYWDKKDFQNNYAFVKYKYTKVLYLCEHWDFLYNIFIDIREDLSKMIMSTYKVKTLTRQRAKYKGGET